MFDVNNSILRFKHEMQRPADFFKVSAFTFLVFGAVAFAANILGAISFGASIQSPITDNFMSLSSQVTNTVGKIDQ